MTASTSTTTVTIHGIRIPVHADQQVMRIANLLRAPDVSPVAARRVTALLDGDAIRSCRPDDEPTSVAAAPPGLSQQAE